MSFDRQDRTSDPTCILSALRATDNEKQLRLNSSLTECLQAHVNGAPQSISLFVENLPRKSTITENDAGASITTAFKTVFTPKKVSQVATQKDIPSTPTAAAENPSNLSDREGFTQIGTSSNAKADEIMDNDVGGDVMKRLMDSAKLSATAGPLIPFLKGIIECQSASFISNVEELGDQHPIYKAITACNLRMFRDEFESLFDKTYPRIERMTQLIKDTQSLQYDENQSILTFRSMLIKLTKRADELLDRADFVHHKSLISQEMVNKVMITINSIRDMDIRYEIRENLRGSANQIDDIVKALQTSDINLRRNHPNSYPPVAISINNTMEANTTKQYCQACKVQWNKNYVHKLEKCHSHPNNRINKADWIAMMNERFIKENNKQPGVFSAWPKENPNKKRGAEASNVSSPKRERGI